MLDILRFDLYKVRKSLSTWLIFASIVIFTLLSSLLTYLAITGDALPEIASEIGGEVTVELISEMSISDWCVDAISGDFLLLFIVVFGVIFASSDFSSGYINNIYGSIKYKAEYIISKVMVIGIFSILSILIAYITCIIFNLIIIRSDTFGNINEFFVFSLVKTSLLIAFGSIVVSLSTIVRKATVSIIVLMGYSFMFVSVFYSGINELIDKVFDNNQFLIEEYTIIGNVISLNLETSSEEYLVMTIMSLTAILVSIIVGSIIFKKRDI